MKCKKYYIEYKKWKLKKPESPGPKPNPPEKPKAPDRDDYYETDRDAYNQALASWQQQQDAYQEWLNSEAKRMKDAYELEYRRLTDVGDLYKAAIKKVKNKEVKELDGDKYIVREKVLEEYLLPSFDQLGELAAELDRLVPSGRTWDEETGQWVYGAEGIVPDESLFYAAGSTLVSVSNAYEQIMLNRDILRAQGMSSAFQSLRQSLALQQEAEIFLEQAEMYDQAQRLDYINGILDTIFQVSLNFIPYMV